MTSTSDLSLAYGRQLDAHERDISHLQLWRHTVHRYPHSTAVISSQQPANAHRWIHPQSMQHDHISWTFQELDRASRLLATALNLHNPVEGRPIAVLLSSQAEWALFLWAAAYLHVPFVPINPKAAAKSAEISHMIDLIQPGVIVVSDIATATELEQNVSPASLLEDIPLKFNLADDTQRLDQAWKALADVFPCDQTKADALDEHTFSSTSQEALVLFTSGTTSLPKPCCQSTFNLAAGGLQYAEARKIQSSHRFVQNLPNFHGYGIAWSLCFWSAGGAIILPSKAFEAQSSLECIEKFSATHMSLVPTTARTMLSHPVMEQVDLSSLLSIDVSGADVIPVVINSCIEGFKTPAYTSYGMTESAGTLIWPEGGGSVLVDNAVAAGKVARGTCVKVCAPGTREPIPRGQIGELHNGGAQVISGYRDPHISSAAFYKDEQGTQWVVTGDQAIMKEDGTVLISGRYKDIIIRGGENISPATIEDLLQKCEGVSMAQVVGVPDEMAGEVPIAVITTQHELRVDVNKLKTITSDRLGPAFAPKMVLHLKADLQRQQWPTTTSGKVRKVELRASVQEYLKKQEEQASSNSDASTVESLIRIWRNVSGADGLTASSAIQSFADSLMMMQLSSLVKRDLGRNISVEDYKQCKTIQDQADLVESRPLAAAVQAIKQVERAGPPTMSDMPYLSGNEAEFEQTKALVSSHLTPLALSWEDVEDVMPLPNWDAIFAHRARPTSWTIRFVYHVPASAKAVLEAAKTSLRYHPTFRSIAIEQDDNKALLVPIRPTEAWFKAAVTSGWEVPTKDDLPNLLADHPVHDSAVAPGPMFKLHIAKVLSDDTAGVVLVGSHAVMDMSMTKLWLEDMTSLLTGKTNIVPHESFKQYADAYHHHASGDEAQRGIDYWSKKLARISLVPESTYWPAQRAPEWFKGIDTNWKRWNGAKARPTERIMADEEKCRAQAGIRRMANVRDIARLKSEGNVPVFMLVKAAVALLNIVQTGGHEAIFGTINAARTWPFQADFSEAERSRMSGNPLDIAGCTTEYVLDRVQIDNTMSVLDFMKYVNKDEEANSTYVHAPFWSIVDRLRDPLSSTDTRTFAERERDAEAILPLIRRQSFNWLPMPVNAAPGPGLNFLQQRSRMDNGLTITGFLAGDKKSVGLGLAWDAEHLSFGEANQALETLARLVEDMGRAENWGLTIEQLLAGDAEVSPIGIRTPATSASIFDTIMRVWGTRKTGPPKAQTHRWMRANVHKAEF